MNKSQILFSIITLAILFSCQAQDQTDCNQAVRLKFYSNRIPKGICLKEGYEFSYIYDEMDVNNDGFKDFLFQWRKRDIQDGDTLYFSVYQQLDSTKYKLVKSFDNLYPIYFKDYSLEYNVKDSLLNELQGQYGGMYPLNQLEFGDGKILIHLQPGVVDHYFLHYRYNHESKNWYLEYRIYSEEDYEGKLYEVSNEYLWDKKLSIEKFNYFDYL